MRFPIDGVGSVSDSRSGEEWSGERLCREVLGRTPVLRRLGAAAGKTVVIAHGGTPSFFADLFAIWHAGACAVCLNPALTNDELRNIVSFVNPVAVLVDGNSLDASGVGVPVVRTSEEVGDETDDGSAIPGHQDDDALILFTSGTTGEPKGVLHTFRSLLARTALNQQFIGADKLETTLCVLPTHFGHGLIGNCLTPLLAGKRLVLASGASLQVAGKLGSLIDDYGVTFMSSVPSFWKVVIKLNSTRPVKGTLQRVQVGSAPLSDELWGAIIGWAGTRDVANLYGITETANWLAGASAFDHDPVDGEIGRMWGGSAAVRLEDGRICSRGVGEILVQTPSLMKGYFKRPDLTEAVLPSGWFCTGDIGRIDDDGTMYLVGRQKYEINRGGLKVHPEDIDILLERHPAVTEACAFAVPDEIAGETVGVAVSLKEGATATVEELRGWCLERLLREKTPERWFIVPEIPKTDRGKLNRDVVARHCLG